jgi:hypothetical protein
MSLDEESFDHSSFTRNRDRLLIHDVAKEFFRTVVEQARAAGLLSDEHFSVDGTLIEAWASLKTFPPPDDPGNPTVSFHGEQRSNATHESTTDPESKLARKPNAAAAKPSYSQHALIENRNGLLVDIRVAEANGTAECETALEMIGESLPGTRRITVGGDIVGAAYNLLRMSRLLPASSRAAASAHCQARGRSSCRDNRPAADCVSQQPASRPNTPPPRQSGSG